MAEPVYEGKRLDVVSSTLLGCTVALLITASMARSQSPYIGQESREIKALSPQEISDYLAGKGMGFAKAAELNGYPGPAHVLELGERLQLTDAQRAETQALFDAMQAKAMVLGRELVEEERRLDRLFASKSADPASVGASLARIGDLQARVRAAHLDAHLAQVRILTSEQTSRYVELRGYSGHLH